MKKYTTLKPLCYAILLAGLGSSVNAQEVAYPDRPVSLIVSAAPGGTTDLAARMIAEPLSKALGQSVVVENKPGASGGIAASQVLLTRSAGILSNLLHRLPMCSQHHKCWW